MHAFFASQDLENESISSILTGESFGKQPYFASSGIVFAHGPDWVEQRRFRFVYYTVFYQKKTKHLPKNMKDLRKKKNLKYFWPRSTIGDASPTLAHLKAQ